MSYFLTWGDANFDQAWDLDDLNQDGIVNEVDQEWLDGLNAAGFPTASKTVTDLYSHLTKFADVVPVVIPDTMKDPYAIREKIAQACPDATGVILLGNFPSFKLQLNYGNRVSVGSCDNLYGDFNGQFGHRGGVHNYYSPDVTKGLTTDLNQFPKTYVQPRWVCRINPFLKKGEHFYVELLKFLGRVYKHQWHEDSFCYLLDTTQMSWPAPSRYERLFNGFMAYQQKMRGIPGYDYAGHGVFVMHPDSSKIFWSEIPQNHKILVYAGHGFYGNQGDLNIGALSEKTNFGETVNALSGAEFIKLDGCATAGSWAKNIFQGWIEVENISQYLHMNLDTKIVVGNGIETAGGFWSDESPTWFDGLLARNGHVGRVIQDRINRKTGDWTQIFELALVHYGWPALKWPGGSFFIEETK